MNYLARFSSNPRLERINAVKHALGQLSAHLKIVLHLYIENPVQLNIRVYMHANWAGSKADKNSTSGYAMIVCQNLGS
jgi:hypothetical protein